MRARLHDWLKLAFLICSCGVFVSILPAQQKPAAPQGIDALTAPIALYPDALIAQVLDASTNPAEVRDFSKWLKENASLKGSELQEAASKANFDAAFIVGAAVNNSNNNYYRGPYAWHRPTGASPYAYNAAALQNQRYNNAASLQNQRYNNTASLQQQRYNNASNLQDQKQANYQQNSSQPQSAAQSNQSQRQ